MPVLQISARFPQSMLWYPSCWRHAIWFLDSVGTSAPLLSAIISFSPTLPSCRHMPWHVSECHRCVDYPLLQPLLEQDVWFLHAVTCLSPPSSMISSHQIGLPPFVDYVQGQVSALARSVSFVNSIAFHNGTYHPKARWSQTLAMGICMWYLLWEEVKGTSLQEAEWRSGGVWELADHGIIFICSGDFGESW